MNPSANSRMKVISSATIVLAVFTLLSRIFGLVRDRVLAQQFGVDIDLDIYNAAFRVPDFLFNFFILGTLTVAFLPILNKLLVRDQERAAEFAGTVYMLSVGAIAALSFVIFIFTPQIINLLFTGFEPAQRQTIIKMTRVMLISPVLFTASNLAAVLLQSYDKFLPTAIAPILYNMGIILGAVFLSDYFGLMGLAYGVILGAFMHAALNLAALKKIPLKLKFRLNGKLEELREMRRLYLPRLLAFDTYYMSLLIATLVGQFLAAGSITTFVFASNLYAVPIGIFALSYSVAAFPSLSRAWAMDQLEEFKSIILKTALQILFFIIPITALMYILRVHAVRLVYGARGVGWEETLRIANTLGVLLISLFAQSLIPLLARSFYSAHNTKVPVLVSIIATLVNVGLALTLSASLGVVGLGVATTVAAVLGFFALALILRIKVGSFDYLNIFERVLKMLISAVVAATAAYATLYAVAPFVNTRTFLGIFIQALLAGAVGVVIYIIIGLFLNLEETKSFARRAFYWLYKLAKPVSRGDSVG